MNSCSIFCNTAFTARPIPALGLLLRFARA
jgi:hypothetical protein